MRRTLPIALAILLAPAFALAVMEKSKSVAAKGRVFEMRTYVAHEGKFEALNSRFRDHTVAFFKKHGMESVGYWIPQDEKDGSANTLVYIIAHESREKAKQNWAAFVADPERKKVFDESEKDGKLVAKITAVYLDPTDYSAIK